MQNFPDLKSKAIAWANTFEVCCILDSNGYADPRGKYDWVIAAGAAREFSSQAGNVFNSLKTFYEADKNFLFGYFSYDLKNETENLNSANYDNLGFPDVYFFQPAYLITSKKGFLEVVIGNKNILNVIDRFPVPPPSQNQEIDIRPRLTKEEYLAKVRQLKEHIRRGDVYEINFCQEFFAENLTSDPLQLFHDLSMLSPTPFSGFFRLHNHFIISATPERFLSKSGSGLLSQPIKGTAKRSLDPAEDEVNRQNLKVSSKEQAENVMIVDLVRHDLTKSAVRGSVKVDELFGVYTFPQVHQLISSVSCELDPAVHFLDAIKNSFPMGSMTGAPKVKAMELIEQYEVTRRGVYSGAFGWISPEEDFDFNVVIRTMLYNADSKYLSFHVGGAITFGSDPEQEYEECLLKATAIMQVLSPGK